MRRSIIGALLAAALLLLAACGQEGAYPEAEFAPQHDEAVADGSLADNKNLLHDTPNPDGHVPANVNYGFEVVGQSTLAGVADGLYTDVWAHDGFAYVGTFQEPTCDRAGVFIVDIREPAEPVVVGTIPSPPETRINDVKVHTVGDTDVLIHTLEPCGPLVGTANQGQGGHQQGQGGISLWDVTDPHRPRALKQNFLATPVHNTFAWTDAEGSYLLAVDDVNPNDVIVVDISKPQSPKTIAVTGFGDWIESTSIGDDGQLFTGSFAAPLLHDVWVEQIGDRWQAVLSYWDAGFITLDVTDPADPLFIADSTYPDPDPVHGISPAEGNAHAAVFGGPGFDKIFGGDEDFDALFTAVSVGGSDYPATQGSDVPQVGPGNATESLTGDVVFVGRACTPLDPSLAAGATGGSIALVERGDCTFTAKATHAEAAGYDAVIVFNQPSSERDDRAGCETSISMLVEAGIPALFVPRSVGYAALNEPYDPELCGVEGDTNADLPAPGTLGATVTIAAVFDGWGYFHVLNNEDANVTVSYGMDGDTRTADYLGEIGYYAPAEATDPALASGAGDLTMHNLEIDPNDPDRVYISWYSAGMRAVEWREGHLHTNANGEGVVSWNVHEVGRFIADEETWGDLAGSNFWGVHVTEVDGATYILGSDRNTGLWIFQWTCEDATAVLYCDAPAP